MHHDVNRLNFVIDNLNDWFILYSIKGDMSRTITGIKNIWAHVH